MSDNVGSDINQIGLNRYALFGNASLTQLQRQETQGTVASAWGSCLR